MGREFFKSQIGLIMKVLRIYGVGHYYFQCQIGCVSCIFVGKSGLGHTKLSF